MTKRYFSVGIGILLILLLSAILVVVVKSEDKLSNMALNGNIEKSDSVKSKPRLSILPAGNNPTLGVDSAKVKIVAFVDYQCGYCRAFVQQQLPVLMEEYVDKNLVQITFRDYPLSFHENAGLLAKAAHVMADKDEFPEFLKNVWDVDPAADSTGIFNAFSIGEISEVQSRKAEMKIRESKFLAGVAGISATPTIIINNRMLVGLRSNEELKSMIEYSIDNNAPVQKTPDSCGQ